MVAGGSRNGVEASSSHAPPWLERSSGGHGAGAGERQRTIPPLRRRPRGAAAVGGAAQPRHFAQSSAERGAADPRWPCVACLPGMMPLLLTCSVVFVFVSRRLLVFVCWRQELELRNRDRYGALDQMSAELRQLREQRDAFDALAEALRTWDGWLSYRVVVLRDQLLERAPLPLSGFARPSSTRMRRCGRREGIWRGRAPWRPTRR
jgi:hypothetical protein